MSSLAFSSASMLSRLFPRLSLQFPHTTSQLLRYNHAPNSLLTVAAAAAAPASIVIEIPSLLSDIWDSVLRAVPKKKTSHMKKRHRQMAGKALKDHLDLNTCSSCGQPKRAHLLCPTCVSEIKQEWREAEKKADKSS
ncbi:WD domain-containing protein [Histoplasma capsulatum G186AR]|uniref:Large ribosomal subunit protein bL32m n=1 Tax=Ajellomyces capsulatus TaxID=5037 RepID=A0A8H7YPS2_AJECA|nr:WD domain-containing protein [Histoplasma capsulatum]QSS74986.1 WD domain-containing protein [Histoplasma capsulatum G186AR]